MAKFEVGNPGGPGRPRGSRTVSRFIFEEIGEEAAQKVMNKVVAAAENGDLRAAELLFRHMCPRRKGRPVNFDMPPVRKAQDVLTAQEAVIGAIGEGTLTPEEGASVSAVLESQRQAIEMVEFEVRL